MKTESLTPECILQHTKMNSLRSEHKIPRLCEVVSNESLGNLGERSEPYIYLLYAVISCFQF